MSSLCLENPLLTFTKSLHFNKKITLSIKFLNRFAIKKITVFFTLQKNVCTGIYKKKNNANIVKKKDFYQNYR